MRKLTIRFIVALLTFILGITATMIFLTQRKQELNRRVPEGWGDFAFKVIDKRSNAAELPTLRNIQLPDGDLEVRIWVGFGIVGEDALILRRSAGKWSALHLHGMFFGRYPPPKYQETFAVSEPRSGWEGAWQKLDNAGILTLPDAWTTQCRGGGLDGTRYIVEIDNDKTYRTYMYDNPNPAKCYGAKQIIKIGEIVAEEFGLEEFINPE